jgi:hypothetical protein
MDDYGADNSIKIGSCYYSHNKMYTFWILG